MSEQKPPGRRPLPSAFLIIGISFVAIGISGGNDAFLYIGIVFLVIAMAMGFRRIRSKKP
jgi:hypothetical protein